MSHPNGRFRDIPNELVNIFSFYKQIRIKRLLEKLERLGTKTTLEYIYTNVVAVVVRFNGVDERKYIKRLFIYKQSKRKREREKRKVFSRYSYCLTYQLSTK